MAILYKRLLIAPLVLAMWVIARPFSGVWHDGKFYALQALQHLNPAAYSRDLFFLYGSQDQYSLFSQLHAAAISLWGLNPGTMVLQGLGLGLWCVAAWLLTRILPGKLAALSLLLIACVDGHYGSHDVFSYGESFLTARLYAEALSLAGLAAWLAGRKALGGLAFAAACAMHPLIALPAMMIGLGMLLRPGIWFGIMGAGALLVLGLGAAGVSPFTGLLQPMDALWFELAAARSPFVFLHTWEWEGFSQTLFVLVVTGTAWRILPEGQLKRLAGVTLTCVLGAFAIAYLGGSLLKLPLIAGLQLTRVMWIGLVVTLILLPEMLWESRQGGIWNRILIWGLALGVFLDMKTQGGYAVLVLVIFWLGKRHLPEYRPPVWLWLMLGLVPLQIMLWGMLTAHMDTEWADITDEQSVWRAYFSNPAAALVLVAGAYWLLGRERLPKFLVWSGGAIVAGLLGLAFTTWSDLLPKLDYDSPDRLAAIAPIAAHVPKNATVYWVDEPDKAWFWLGRANYLSFAQTAGSVFSRGTAIEALRRAPYVKQASLLDSNQVWDERRQTLPSGEISQSAVRQACRDPILDFVIARSRPATDIVYFRDPATGWGYGLYDCRALRGPGTTVSTSNAVDVQERIWRNL
ncbi:hypothetical protein [Thiobacillus sp.]|uniref:hypothetical protein n=1 Tax=Thiobacillus sp. TaxID=924 RepID=UPI00286EA75D|nr:hypothetical protein [Thiobacillus sp.]